MDNRGTLRSLKSLFKDVSDKLTVELARPLPDAVVLLECRKQLSQLDKHIRRIQVQKDWID